MVDLKINVPAEFFREEERCGYLVSEQMKKVWAVELDLMEELNRVCDRHGLKYYALGGTLLGAVRHKGFIPWDDDIDLIMPRRDYDILRSLPASEFQEPYFLSSPDTEYRFWRKHIQLRNSMTTGTTKLDRNRNNNKGIFIDIMPMDAVPATVEGRNQHRQDLRKVEYWAYRKMWAEGVLDQHKTPGNLVRNFVYGLHMYSDAVYKKTFAEFNRELSRYADKNTGTLGHASLLYGERGIWPVEWYEDSVMLDFEFTKIRVPARYVEVLHRYYGEDCLELPKNPPSSDHGDLFMDPDKPFTEYFKWKRK